MATERKEETPVRKSEAPVEELRNLFRTEQRTPVYTWRPTTGGILEIVAGGLNIIQGIVVMVTGAVVPFLAPFMGTGAGIGVALVILGVISIIGGSQALRRHSWGWTLAGAITALVTPLSFVLGTLALIFDALGKPEFKK